MFDIGAFLSYALVVTFTPGPNNIMCMANASKFGYKKTLNFILGVFTGFFIILILSSYFNLLLFNLLPKIEIYVGILGAGYMIYLAIKIMKTQEETETEDSIEENTDEEHLPPSDKVINKPSSFFTGVTMQFLNPKGILYAITVISAFIMPYYNSNISLILFSLFLCFLTFTSNSCWALFGSLFNKFISKYRKQFNIAMGILLIYSAISISGITNLF